MVKENSNPTVHAVNRRRRTFASEDIRLSSEDWQSTITTKGNKNGFSFTTHSDKSLAVALKSISTEMERSTSGNDVNLRILKNAGLCPDFDERKGDETIGIDEPLFLPYTEKLKLKQNFHKKKQKRDVFDAEEIFDMIRDINDPEHPLTLEQLNVVSQNHIEVHDMTQLGEKEPIKENLSICTLSSVDIKFTPTIPHCSMATLIGLSIRVKLLRSLPSRFKVQVKINPGTHASEKAINRQLNDKERVAAALENSHLLNVVNKCIALKH